ncbi:MAG TPA: helix-turn-helix domain-containing protein [Xanthobacteraceae bacterium]|nr:helix-turn-helix domain-containing protein [Xanthobacteraceae bacterium]
MIRAAKSEWRFEDGILVVTGEDGKTSLAVPISSLPKIAEQARRIRRDLLHRSAKNPIQNVRKNILRLSQKVMAEVAGVSQGTVSNWESGASEPTRREMARVRTFAIQRGITWDDRWFFEIPIKPAINTTFQISWPTNAR